MVCSSLLVFRRVLRTSKQRTVPNTMESLDESETKEAIPLDRWGGWYHVFRETEGWELLMTKDPHPIVTRIIQPMEYASNLRGVMQLAWDWHPKRDPHRLADQMMSPLMDQLTQATEGYRAMVTEYDFVASLVSAGAVEALEFLRSRPYSEHFLFSEACFSASCTRGHLPLVQWYLTHYPNLTIQCVQKGLLKAVPSGVEPVVHACLDWLAKRDWPNSSVTIPAIESWRDRHSVWNHKACARQHDDCLHELLIAACYTDMVEVVRRILPLVAHFYAPGSLDSLYNDVKRRNKTSKVLDFLQEQAIERHRIADVVHPL